MNVTNTRAPGALLACLMLSLTACGATRQIVKTETVEVKVPVYVPLPRAMTEEEAEPAVPAAGATTEALVQYLEDVRAWGRRGWGKVREIRAVQPEVADESRGQ